MSSTEVELVTLETIESRARPSAPIAALGATPNAGAQTPAAIAGAEHSAPSKSRSAVLMTTLSCITLLNTFNTGALTTALPVIATELVIPDNLLLWPASVYALGLGCSLLLLGAVADIVGNRPVFLIGSLLYTVWTLAVGLSRTANELIAFRVLQGISMAFCMPTAVSIITTTFPSGKTRNMAFAIFGGGNPLGFALGLVMGGVFVQVSTWRTAFYAAAGVNAATFCAAWYTLPRPAKQVVDVRHKLLHDFDWVGIASASTCLALLSYIFAEIANNGSVMRKPYNIVLLVVAVLLIPFFVFWVGRQERLGRPAILPNSIWRQREFTAVCLTVFLLWAWFNAFGYWCTLFFQVTQGLTSLEAALRFLPLVIVGILTNVVAGFTMDKIPAGTLALVGGLASAAGPILFAILDPSWSYWVAGFPALCLCVISTDFLFNISNLVITASFPGKDQALAGGVFNTVTQLGNSIGPAVTAMIAAAVTNKEMGKPGTSQSDATLQGYRAAFWACFGAAVISIGISSVGLRKAGKVGMKRD